MTLHIYDSLKRKKLLFQPRQKNRVSIYVCGMTVYDYCHVGHARVLVCFDMITRYLRYKGYDVTYVRNITDIDDKIIQRAQENNQAYTALTQYFIQAMHEDAGRLNVLPPDIEPRATEHIETMITMIGQLIAKGVAYQADNGDVYYDVTRFPDYGGLAHQSLDSLKAGARVEIDVDKRHPLDFVLWKLAKPGEPCWPSPWGKGRPGCHIECSAMSTHYLGPSLDMHGGGVDLQFPHHQNELAQSEAACEACFVNHWLHVGHVRVNQEKMSKSLGNFFTIRDVLRHYSAETIRYFILASHYRSPVNYTKDNLNSALAGLTRLYTALRYLPDHASGDALSVDSSTEAAQAYKQRFIEKMDDDFNTPDAFAVLFDMAHDVHKHIKGNKVEQASQLAAALKDMASVLGLLQSEPDDFLQAGFDKQAVEQIESLIAERNEARHQKDWAKADAIRNELIKQGVDIEDDASGRTLWKRKHRVNLENDASS